MLVLETRSVILEVAYRAELPMKSGGRFGCTRSFTSHVVIHFDVWHCKSARFRALVICRQRNADMTSLRDIFPSIVREAASLSVLAFSEVICHIEVASVGVSSDRARCSYSPFLQNTDEKTLGLSD